jgi:hypothetical protein
MAEPRPEVNHIDAVFDALRTLSGTMASLLTLSPQQASLGALLEALQGGGRPDDVTTIIKDLMDRMLPRAKSVRTALEHCQYPYEHAKGRLSLSQYLMPEVPVKNDLGSIYNSCGQVLEAAPTLYVRLLGEIVHTAECVETACGLPPLPDPTAEKALAV